MAVSQQCAECEHYTGHQICPAFPLGIPKKYFVGYSAHDSVDEEQISDVTYTPDGEMALRTAEKGGQGSGNWGHEGMPGVWGGGQEGGGSEAFREHPGELRHSFDPETGEFDAERHQNYVEDLEYEEYEEYVEELEEYVDAEVVEQVEEVDAIESVDDIQNAEDARKYFKDKYDIDCKLATDEVRLSSYDVQNFSRVTDQILQDFPDEVAEDVGVVGDLYSAEQMLWQQNYDAEMESLREDWYDGQDLYDYFKDSPVYDTEEEIQARIEAEEKMLDEKVRANIGPEPDPEDYHSLTKDDNQPAGRYYRTPSAVTLHPEIINGTSVDRSDLQAQLLGLDSAEDIGPEINMEKTMTHEMTHALDYSGDVPISQSAGIGTQYHDYRKELNQQIEDGVPESEMDLSYYAAASEAEFLAEAVAYGHYGGLENEHTRAVFDTINEELDGEIEIGGSSL